MTYIVTYQEPSDLNPTEMGRAASFAEASDLKDRLKRTHQGHRGAAWAIHKGELGEPLSPLSSMEKLRPRENIRRINHYVLMVGLRASTNLDFIGRAQTRAEAIADKAAHLYTHEGLSIRKIAKELGENIDMVHRALKLRAVKMRAQTKDMGPYLHVVKCAIEYQERTGATIAEVEERFGFKHKTFNYHRKKYLKHTAETHENAL